MRRRWMFAGSQTGGILSTWIDQAISRTSWAMIAERDDNHWTSHLASEDAVLRASAVSDLRDMLLRAVQNAWMSWTSTRSEFWMARRSMACW